MNSRAKAERVESPGVVYGRLLEGFHISGYTFERAVSELSWMLDAERWRKAGRFNSVDEFVASIDLSSFKATVEQRKEIVEKLNRSGVSQRKTAKVIGVDEKTVRNDLAPPRAEKSASTVPKALKSNGANVDSAEKSASAEPARAPREQTDDERIREFAFEIGRQISDTLDAIDPSNHADLFLIARHQIEQAEKRALKKEKT